MNSFPWAFFDIHTRPRKARDTSADERQKDEPGYAVIFSIIPCIISFDLAIDLSVDQHSDKFEQRTWPLFGWWAGVSQDRERRRQKQVAFVPQRQQVFVLLLIWSADSNRRPKFPSSPPRTEISIFGESSRTLPCFQMGSYSDEMDRWLGWALIFCPSVYSHHPSSEPSSAPLPIISPFLPIHPVMFRTSIRRTNLRALAQSTSQTNRLPALVVRRGYADAAKSENLKLSFSVPHQSIFANKEV